MPSLIASLLALLGLAGMRTGRRRAAFASERAEYIPACFLLQAASLCWWLHAIGLGAAILLFVSQCAGAIALGARVHGRPLALRPREPGRQPVGVAAATPGGRLPALRSGS